MLHLSTRNLNNMVHLNGMYFDPLVHIIIQPARTAYCIVHIWSTTALALQSAPKGTQSLEYLVKGALVHKRATMAPLDAPRWGRPETTLLICFLPLPEV